MSASGLTATDSLVKKKQVCGACHKRRELLEGTTGFSSLLMERYLTPSDFAEAQAVSDSATLDGWSKLELDGIPIGKYSAYEFLLHYKILGVDIPEELFPVYRDQLRICVLTMRASQRILDEQKPEVVLTYNRLYGVNHAFLVIAERRGIPTYTLQGGGHVTHRGETMTMFRDNETYFDIFDKKSWINYKDEPIGEREVSLVNSHFDGLMEASSAFAYSSAFEASEPDALRTRFAIPADAPVLLIPMSSEDELNAAQLADFWPDTSGKPNVFADQFSWIRFLFEFAKTRPNYRFILRLHPRMFPNKRENVVAPVVAMVMKLIEDAPSNVIINMPSDNVSIYDLLQIVDVLLGYRSTVGAEFAAFGVPVVAPANKDFFTYPAEVNRTGYTKKEFAKLIDDAVVEGWSIENMRIVYRWFAFQFTRIAVDFSDSVNAKPSAIRPKKPGFRLWLWRKMVFLIIQFGPLIRERIALRGRSSSESTKDIFADVIENGRGNLAESVKWKRPKASRDAETALLRERLEFLNRERWNNFVSEKSLAATISTYLAKT
ncbi:MAG: hypothetical protein NTY82_02835 [Actinobacteria bacterium]|nr:hypothetical protein [Actinomycetota bacterium]